MDGPLVSTRSRSRAIAARFSPRSGKGTAWVFRDGHVIKGTWRKKDSGDLTRLYDASGKEIPLVRGRIFFQVVADRDQRHVQDDELTACRATRRVTPPEPPASPTP